MAAKTKLTEHLNLLMPPGAAAALDELAALSRMSRAECIRQTLWRELRSAGIALEPVQAELERELQA
jgi:hypothetical protein